VKKIAVIPARGGSKRIPRKNIKVFFGKPMIYWTIQAAKKSGLFDEIIVSTEDNEIANISRALGATIPFVRPDILADDFSTTHDVMLHAAECLMEQGYDYDYLCCLYPCSPFIYSEDLVQTFNVIQGKKDYYIYPIAEYPHPIHRAMRLTPENQIHLINSSSEKTRTQDITPAYHDVGQFYWGAKETWLKVSQMHSNAYGHVIPNWRAIDIDSDDDWNRAEIIFNALKPHV
jgi:pseudaminic acid cytidylyltransferase